MISGGIARLKMDKVRLVSLVLPQDSGGRSAGLGDGKSVIVGM
jgi:hypothetical protein